MTLVSSCRDSGLRLCCGSSLSNCCIPLSCIAVHGRLAGCTDRVGLGLLCVYLVCVCKSVAVIQIWRSPRNMAHSTGNLTKRSRTNLHEGAKAENKKEEHILLCCSCICWRSLAEMPVSTLKAFATGNLNELCALQHFPTGCRRRKNTDLRFLAFTWCVNNTPQLFCWELIHLPTLHRHHLSQHRAQFIVLCEASVDLQGTHLSY